MRNKRKPVPVTPAVSTPVPPAAPSPAAPPTPLRMLRLKEVIRRTGLSRTTIYKLQSEGKFPSRVKLTERSSAWPEHEVQAYIERRMSERPAPRSAP